MYRIVFTKRAHRALRKIPRDIAQRIRKSLDHIAIDPYAQHSNATKLQNRPGYRLRVGDWRVLYEMEDDELVVLVIRIGPRGGVYR